MFHIYIYLQTLLVYNKIIKRKKKKKEKKNKKNYNINEYSLLIKN